MRTKERVGAPRLLPEGCTEDGRRFLSLAETAACLGVARSTLYAAASRGDVSTVRVGGRLLVSVASILDGSLVAKL